MKILRSIAIAILAILTLSVVVFFAYRPMEETSHHYGHGDSTYLHLCTSTAEFYDSLLTHIDNAHSTIYLEIYEFAHDSVGTLFMHHLAEKAQSGVKVDIMLDGYGSRHQWAPDSLARLGVHLCYLDTFRFPYINHILSRNHRKLAIIDSSWVSIGCTNLADYYIHGLPEVGEWEDMALLLSPSNPSVRILETKVEYVAELQSLIQNAQHEIAIVNPYIALPANMKSDLKAAVERGVKVRYLIGERGDIPEYQCSSMGYLRQQQLLGAEVNIYPHGFIHTKALCVDNERLFIGSVNLCHRSLDNRRNVEIAAVVTDSATISDFYHKYCQLCAECHPLNDSTWQALPPLTRFKYKCYNTFNPLILK